MRGAKIQTVSKEKINGVDRLDSTKGYFLANCVAACKRCNQGKNNMTVREFLAWVRKIVSFQKA